MMNNFYDSVNIYSSSYYEDYQHFTQSGNFYPSNSDNILNLHNFVQNFDPTSPTNDEAKNSKQTRRTKNEDKPPFSYISLIVMALENSPDHRCTLADIYDYLKSRFDFFRGTYQGWKNSIRHNLSLNDCFVKLPKKGEMSSKSRGKGHFWTLSPDYASTFEDSTLKRRRRGYKNKRDCGEKFSICCNNGDSHQTLEHLINDTETPYNFLSKSNKLYTELPPCVYGNSAAFASTSAQSFPVPDSCISGHQEVHNSSAEHEGCLPSADFSHFDCR